jgi:hypothetical protein
MVLFVQDRIRYDGSRRQYCNHSHRLTRDGNPHG